MPAEKYNFKKDRIYLLLAVILTIASMAYWIITITHAYNTFQDGTIDLNLYSYNVYFNLHYPSIANGLQFIAAADHLSPDMLLLMPIFYMYQHSITLLYIQIVVISLLFLIFFIS